MKTLFLYSLYFFVRFSLFLRYRLKVVGEEKLTSKQLSKKEGIIFLANHPAEIDPCILLAVLWRKFRPHPIAIEYLFHKPAVRFFLDLIGSLPVPNFEESSNSFKQKQIDATYQRLLALLSNKENLLIYPAGGLKSHGEERIGGASGVHKILELAPEANVVLIRTTGLWGSSFSRAQTGRTPEIMGAFAKGLKVLVKNLLFFTPRRLVTIEIEPAPADFPYKASRRELNRYLEDWYNIRGPEPLSLVSYSMWREELPEIPSFAEKELRQYEEIPEEIREKIKKEISQLANIPLQSIEPEQELARDLGLDSLDQAQLVVMLKESYGIGEVRSSDLLTVESVMAFAAGCLESEKEGEEEEKLPLKWESGKGRPRPFPAEGKTIPEVFLATCERMGDFLACTDALSGEVSYKRLKLGVILMAQSIAGLPGDRIGILLPASTAVNVVILATLLAGKVPVMINWTLGKRNLQSIFKQAGIQKTISSWHFLDRLENVDLDGFDEQVVILEEMRRKLTFRQKAKAIWIARKGSSAILKYFRHHKVSEQDPAVILFTSGTENFPKPVPLSHVNILANQRDAFQYVDLKEDDVLLGALPPFHSFGFTVTGLFPLLTGLRVAFSPNPTDGRRLALSIEKWKVTMLCLAPTFMKNITRIASVENLKTLRLVVVGAEKMSLELVGSIKALNPNAIVTEGYGITECSPILTLNPPNKEQKGVGLPLPRIELKIVHPEDYSPQEIGKEGLILARGPNVFSGYLDPSLPSPFIELEGEQWYKTGDLGWLDKEGYLTLSGRLKRFVKIGGEMISLNAIEEVLQHAPFNQNKGPKNAPDTPTLAVSALEEDGKKGEIHLFIIYPISLEEVNRELKSSGMSNLIRISAIHQVPFIPLLGSGKIDYRSLTMSLKMIGK